MNNRLKIFTWHIHGSYLYYLSQGDYDIYIPVNDEKNEGYYGRGKTFPFSNNVIEIEAENVRYLNFDCILFQTNKNFLIDQYEILSDEQQNLPKIYLEHNTPLKHPTDTEHVMNDADCVLVHVTHFNKLMWKSNATMVKIIEHGITPSKYKYSGELERGIVVVNHIEQRGRITGWDIFKEVRKHIPLDLVGMGTKQSGGLDEVLHPDLPEFISRYRFFFNPIRYTSMGLAVCEAMITGLPIVAIATTEYVTVIQNKVQGFISTDVNELISNMKLLLQNHSLALALGENAKQTALERFDIKRFIQEWKEVFHLAISKKKNKHEEKYSIYQ